MKSNASKPADPHVLRVAEAAPKDVGRGIVRLDPTDLALLGGHVGDVIEITGQRRAFARAMPSYAEARGSATLQMDGVVRANAKAGIGDRVTVAKAVHAPAARIVLRPTSGQAPLTSTDSRHVAKLLDGMPTAVGDRVRATLVGSRYREFEVMATTPKAGCVIVSPETVLSLQGEGAAEPKASGVSWEDVGGLKKEMGRVREMIELPLRHPGIFERLGIDPPKGVLLHGPPGTGKTLLARAVAHETEAAFLSISGPEIIQKFYGESEARLRSIFEQARRSAPCIIFIDEIDAIAPKRETVQGEVEKRVVAQLLSLMDGLEGRGQVIVIAATNLPNSLDPALRRPGRFDREIEIGVPDAAARREILEIHVRGMPLAEDVDLDRIAAQAHGFVGADFDALTREAAMTALRRIMPHLDLSGGELSWEKLEALVVTMADFQEAFCEIEPSALREFIAEVPDVSWEAVGGVEEVKRELREAVEWPLLHPALYAAAKVQAPRGILLHGLPGTGKTLLAKAVASRGGLNFIAVRGPELLSKYVGESERAIRQVFRKARQARPCVIFFDELDAIAQSRSGHGGDSGVGERVLAQILVEMDGIDASEGVLVMAATNRLDMLDAALVRPGRFDLILEIPMPDLAAREAIWHIQLAGRPTTSDVDCKMLAAACDGMSGAEIELACRRAAMSAVRQCVASGEQSLAAVDLTISQADLKAAVAEARVAAASRAHAGNPKART
jgi:transitional endoplasmic reticulum ATPase